KAAAFPGCGFFFRVAGRCASPATDASLPANKVSKSRFRRDMIRTLRRAPGRRWVAPAAVGIAASAHGQDRPRDARAEALDEIVVTATRRASPVREVPRSISVVGQERIQNATQQLALDEALSGVPGLYMQNRYNFSQDLRISLRGFGARSGFGIRGVRVYVDGIPETLPDGQAGVDSIDLG